MQIFDDSGFDRFDIGFFLYHTVKRIDRTRFFFVAQMDMNLMVRQAFGYNPLRPLDGAGVFLLAWGEILLLNHHNTIPSHRITRPGEHSFRYYVHRE
ncbi:MAG: hypothetical protein KAG53_02840 [Endozoicomonadaceae bacterium]|nr:hypothetical protein [Endozoicomonadaceae bacterium]